MANYSAIFMKIEGLSETDVGGLIRLEAATREGAEDEALALPRPEGANFVKLILDGQFERGCHVWTPPVMQVETDLKRR